MSKFLLNLLVQISKAWVYSKIQFLFEKESSSDFGSSGPAPPALARFAPQSTRSPLSPFGPSSLGVFAERCISFDFAHSGKDTFSLSRHCHLGPTCQLHPLPTPADLTHGATSPGRLRPPYAARPPTSRYQARSSLPTLIPPFNPPLNPSLSKKALVLLEYQPVVHQFS
jgi:hypothetical protein